MNIKDATDEALDSIVRKAGNTIRENARKRLQEIAQDVAATPITEQAQVSYKNGRASEAAKFREIRKRHNV